MVHRIEPGTIFHISPNMQTSRRAKKPTHLSPRKAEIIERARKEASHREWIKWQRVWLRHDLGEPYVPAEKKPTEMKRKFLKAIARLCRPIPFVGGRAKVKREKSAARNINYHSYGCEQL